ncbi:hypothetical protein C2S53_008458 [Perilla frutescens var. hirtella]|uniref:Glycosyltransferase N-terminal domain-containing protein n=1 Tax=Perilla frutescens var. hirtella TaxID=608512 RepID=A0AAD4IVD0_PERFH|nr:hypothetical protein C2S53_008458 [Perilla frutescens var. hirtella]
MGSLIIDHQQHEETTTTATKQSSVAVVIVLLLAQGHLNQMMQLSCLISSYGLPVYYVGAAVHNCQTLVRVNSLIKPSKHCQNPFPQHLHSTISLSSS